MGGKAAKSAGTHRAEKGITARLDKSLDRLKHSYWTIRKTDELVIKTNQMIQSARIQLGKKASRRKPRPAKPPQAEPEREFGELLISAIENPKRRADD